MSYTNTFIVVSEDTKAEKGLVPPTKATPTIAQLQFEMISRAPYTYTQADLDFACYVKKKGLVFFDEAQRQAEWQQFFAKPRACLRTSPLVKTYGWGIHYDKEGKLMIYGRETPDYQQLSQKEHIEKGMRVSRKK
ncbi:DUF6157 family protein [uncultured Vagococcus sp.]|uniref:DUF6157 family protein n=1 Tax=uncultured Vagococcus sp. TaxID=189676 RepID=UPI0028D52644|nr:DUF6157 family protein [uncultured Vagococcus sp.]